jgi:RNA polymerase sigma factor (sigma-70 family)
VAKISGERTMKELGAAVDRLAPRQRAAVLLKVQEDMATYDIARVLKCSEATVRVHLHRALATLKKTMEKR